MSRDPHVQEVAGALTASMGLLVRTLRQAQTEGELTIPERSALARLDRGGPMAATELAKLEQISPQSMGATLGALEASGLVLRRPDPDDRRRAVITMTRAGLQALRRRRSARTALIAQAISTELTPTELEQLRAAAPLIERVAQSI